MNTIAIKPGAGKVVQICTSFYKFNKLKAKSKEREYHWGAEYTFYVWLMVIVALILAVLPVSLIGVSLYSLFGYLWIPFLITIVTIGVNNTSEKELDVNAYKIYSKLKDGWKDHGRLFYIQIYNHDCDKRYGYSYGCNDYCMPRFKELENLLSSQQKIYRQLSSIVDIEFFSASKSFREAAIEAGKKQESELMKQISDSVSRKQLE